MWLQTDEDYWNLSCRREDTHALVQSHEHANKHSDDDGSDYHLHSSAPDKHTAGFATIQDSQNILERLWDLDYSRFLSERLHLPRANQWSRHSQAQSSPHDRSLSVSSAVHASFEDSIKSNACKSQKYFGYAALQSDHFFQLEPN